MPLRDVRGSERVLIWTPFGKDGVQLAKILRAEGFDCLECATVAELMPNLTVAGALLTTEEMLNAPSSIEFVEALKSQGNWSALPIIAFYSAVVERDASQKKAAHPLQEFADLSFIQRPVTASTVIDATRVALRDRKRQYRIKHLLELLEADLADKERYEAELKSAKEASDRDKLAALAASSSKSQFLANMSHEIRTPLGAIMGFLDLLKNPAISRAELDNYISVIDRNSVQLLRLIDDILDLSKVEAGKLDIEHVEFSLVDLISDCASLMGFKAREKGVLFDLILRSELPERVVSDPTRLRQIIVNIVGNAIKFTERGKVEMAVAFVGGELCFTVCDTGRGISEEQMQRLFQAFSQADNSTTRYFGGTGLGLALTRYLSEAMGGSFVLEESEIGKGSTFIAKVHVATPANVTMVRQLNSESGPRARRKAETKVLEGKRILVVEDSPDNQELFTIFLNNAGASVELASDGVSGIELALSGDFDLILMDIQMPRMDGHTATRQLREKGFTRPILALTAHAMKEEREKTSASGFSGFLTKPVKRDSLVAAIVREIHESR